MLYDMLKLENQICFPLYACSREVIKKYKPYLQEIGLTYTQYITMLVMWEQKSLNVKTLGECLYLDSGTLTPLLKKLESLGLIERSRSKQDERNLEVKITQKGEELKKVAKTIPERMSTCMNLSREEARLLYSLLYKILSPES